MRKVQSWFKGLVKKEKLVFISKFSDHVEIVETTTLFGRWVIKEETREVFLPDIKVSEQGKIRVIMEAYEELHEITRRLKNDSI